MKYSDYIENGASDTDIRTFLIEGEPTAVTFRIPKNLKDAATEAAALRGLSFSAFVRTCMIEELTTPRKN